MTPFEYGLTQITKRPTAIYGLKFAPTLEPHVDDNQDTPPWGWPNGPEISDCNLQVLGDVLKKLGNKCNAIVEIGVDRNEGKSFTKLILNNKPTDSKYLGIDVEDKSRLINPEKNIYTIQSNSHDQFKIRSELNKLGISKIDLLMIDGWHSVNTCINDWCYADMLSDHGCVVLHDTNAHPGCITLFHAVDETLFEKTRYCTEMTDMGISTFWHRK